MINLLTFLSFFLLVCISKSEYIVLKLKEMGKVSDKDINQVVNQFDKLDPNNLGKITLPDLLGGPL